MPTDPTTTPTTPAAARVTIRRATPDDAAEVVTMVEEIADLEDQATCVHVHLEQCRRLLTRPDVTVLLAERGSRQIGYVSAIRQHTCGPAVACSTSTISSSAPATATPGSAGS